VAPPGNTPLPPLPGAGGTMHTSTASVNPWASAGPGPATPVPPQPRVPSRSPFPGLSSRTALVDRAPTWVLTLSVLVVIALVAGGAYLVMDGGSKFPKHWDARVEPIASWVERARGLDYKHPVEVKFLTPQEYTQASAGSPDDTPSEESKQQAADQVSQLRALGFLTGDVDLDKASRTLNDSGSLAFYSPESKKVYVRGTAMTPGLRVTLAHELTHVLQDQYFGLDRVSLDEGRGGVLRALAEGDATRIEDKYTSDVLTAAERKAYEKESQDEGDSAQTKLDKEVPPILTTVFAAPYILGPELIKYLQDDGGVQAINRDLDTPPTEEVLFNPIKDGTPEAKAVTVDIKAPDGAASLDDGEFGPTTWYLLLASRMDPRQALQAVDGWGGDRYVVYRNPQKTVCVNIDTTFDTDADQQQFHSAVAAWVAKSPPGKAAVTTDGKTEHFRSCDPGKDAKSIGNPAGTDLLALPASRTDIYTSVRKQDVPRPNAICYAQGVIDAYTLAQLTSDTYVGTPEGQRTLQGVRSKCL
jgi:hypothetical protein